MTNKQLIEVIKNRKNFLCVGLDTDINKLPNHFNKSLDSVLEFNKNIIEATLPYCVAYKINTAFYEAMGSKGWDIMEQTLKFIPETHFTIADAKRGDIGNTSSQYAKAFFETLNFDSVTVAPYMGKDSIEPFLEYENKSTILLALTSNSGAVDFELQKLENGKYLFEKIIEISKTYKNAHNLMYVIGATKTEYLKTIREYLPNSIFLIPGVGFQGGSLSEVYKNGATENINLLVNVSRAIIYASEKEDYAKEAATIAQQYAYEMEQLIKG